MPAYRSIETKTTIGVAVADAFAELQLLSEEMREMADNMESGNLGHTEKCQRCSDAADELENHADEPDVPEFLSDLPLVVHQQVNTRKGRAPSRAVRLDNAKVLIEAARCAADEWKTKDDEPGKEAEEQAEAAEQLAEELGEHADFDVDFPGMYG